MSNNNQDGASQSSLKRPLEDDEKENDICSLQDVIDCETERNEIANAVLGASDPVNCSYKDGYIYRQALYCCITCSKEKLKQSTAAGGSEPDDNLLHGVCLACSYECHANHELYELYTKRNFRCDCGNSKFTNNSCKLEANKDSLNTNNLYNHNFKGEYCVCNRPYPETASDNSYNNDLEENSDEMLQCTICEDWFHLNHLKGNEKFPNSEEDYEEMVCHLCMDKNSFLWSYQGYMAVKADATESNQSENINVSDDKSDSQNLTADGCMLKMLELKNVQFKSGSSEQACCWLNGWREALCKCLSCLKLYKANNVEFLLNANDSIKYYEALGKQKESEGQSIDENKLIDDQLAKLNRVSRVEFLHNVNDFKTELVDFLRSFANNGQVVKRENVAQFFANLENKKKQKLDQFYCTK